MYTSEFFYLLEVFRDFPVVLLFHVVHRWLVHAPGYRQNRVHRIRGDKVSLTHDACDRALVSSRYQCFPDRFVARIWMGRGVVDRKLQNPISSSSLCSMWQFSSREGAGTSCLQPNAHARSLIRYTSSDAAKYWLCSSTGRLHKPRIPARVLRIPCFEELKTKKKLKRCTLGVYNAHFSTAWGETPQAFRAHIFRSPFARIREGRMTLVRFCRVVLARCPCSCASFGPLLEVLGRIVAQRLYRRPESAGRLLPHHGRSQWLRRTEGAW